MISQLVVNENDWYFRTPVECGAVYIEHWYKVLSDNRCKLGYVNTPGSGTLPLQILWVNLYLIEV